MSEDCHRIVFPRVPAAFSRPHAIPYAVATTLNFRFIDRRTPTNYETSQRRPILHQKVEATGFLPAPHLLVNSQTHAAENATARLFGFHIERR
jgi:hypothetical protein